MSTSPPSDPKFGILEQREERLLRIHTSTTQFAVHTGQYIVSRVRRLVVPSLARSPVSGSRLGVPFHEHGDVLFLDGRH